MSKPLIMLFGEGDFIREGLAPLSVRLLPGGEEGEKSELKLF